MKTILSGCLYPLAILVYPSYLELKAAPKERENKALAEKEKNQKSTTSTLVSFTD